MFLWDQWCGKKLVAQDQSTSAHCSEEYSWTYLSAFIHEGHGDLSIIGDILRGQVGADPALLFIWKPALGAGDISIQRHDYGLENHRQRGRGSVVASSHRHIVTSSKGRQDRRGRQSRWAAR